MKKIFGVILVLCVVLALISCASKPPASGGMPSFKLANARRNAPEDVLVGIGNAKMGTVAQSRNIAATRARAEISNTLDSMVKNMVRDYTASSEVDPNAALAFQENITVTLSKSNLSGAVIQFEEPDRDPQVRREVKETFCKHGRLLYVLCNPLCRRFLLKPTKYCFS
jgi:hypothetical protein